MQILKARSSISADCRKETNTNDIHCNKSSINQKKKRVEKEELNKLLKKQIKMFIEFREKQRKF